MDVNIPEVIRQDAELIAAVQQATRFLESKARRSTEPVKAEWGLIRDLNGEDVLQVRLADATASVQARLVPEELLDHQDGPRLLRRLWREFLASRSREQLKRLRQMVEQLEGD